MITQEQAMEIAKEVGLHYGTLSASYIPIYVGSSHIQVKEFTRALNLAAAAALESLITNDEGLNMHYDYEMLAEIAAEYRSAK